MNNQSASGPIARSSEHDAPAAAAPSGSIAQRCHTDALHCIFSCLSLADLLPALQSCHSWNSASCKEPPRSARQWVAPKSIAAMADSALRRHVVALGISAALSLEHLRLLRALPRLTALNATLDALDWKARLQSAGDSREQRSQLVRDSFPPQLCSLTLRYSGARPASQTLVDALPGLPDLRTLHLHTDAPDLDLSPLVQLPRLSCLLLRNRPSLAQCSVLRRLAALTALQTGRGYWNRAALLQLLEPPHSLQRLQAIEFRYETVDPPLLEGLLSLPALTELWADLVQPECLAELGGLTRLQRLRVSWFQIFTGAQRTALESSLNSLPRLSDLELTLSADARVGGQPIGLRLAALSSLRAESVLLPSLSFLQLSPRLESLRLIHCGMPSSDEALQSLRSFAPRLRRLELDRCVRLSDQQESALRPPSALLPALAGFAYLPL